MDRALIIAIAAPMVTAVAAYFVSRRSASGRVDNSPADLLWAEGRSIREELRAELVVLRAEIVSLKVDLAACQKRHEQHEADTVLHQLEAAVGREELAILREQKARRNE